MNQSEMFELFQAFMKQRMSTSQSKQEPEASKGADGGGQAHGQHVKVPLLESSSIRNSSLSCEDDLHSNEGVYSLPCFVTN